MNQCFQNHNRYPSWVLSVLSLKVITVWHIYLTSGTLDGWVDRQWMGGKRIDVWMDNGLVDLFMDDE